MHTFTCRHYAPQTKIRTVEQTNRLESIFEALFTSFQRVVAKSCTLLASGDTTDLLFCLPKSSFLEHQHVADRTDGKSRRHDARLGFELLKVTSVWFTLKLSAYYGAGRLNMRALDDLHESMCNKTQKTDANQSHQICDTVDNTTHLEFHCRTFVDAGVPFRTQRAHAQSQLRLYVERMLDVNVPEYAPCFRGRVSCYLPHDALSSFTIPKQNVSLCLPNEDFGKSYKR